MENSLELNALFEQLLCSSNEPVSPIENRKTTILQDQAATHIAEHD
jgi:hypothetical protein